MVAKLSRIRWLIVILAIVPIVTACGENAVRPTEAGPGVPHPSPFATMATGGTGVTHDHAAMTPAPAGDESPMRVFLVASELIVGPNRFAVGLSMPDNSIIDDAEVSFEYFDTSNPSAPVSESTATATRLASLDGLTVIYAHDRSFDRAGAWGVKIDARRPDGTLLTRNISFVVLADSPTLAIGEAAPASASPTLADVDDDLAQLTSASEPNPALYELSIADALANDKPTLVLFATPSFCQTRFCGPDYEIVSDLQHQYGDQLNMIHVEIYSGLPDPAESGWQYAQPMLDFGLMTEPWLYVIDADGIVTWRVEGLFTEAEVVTALAGVGVRN